MAVPLETLVKQLGDSGIIAQSKLEPYIPPQANPKDGEQLLRELYKQGLLTKFQAQQFAAGKVKSLVLGEYTILDKIGAGGMGQVFKALHRRMERTVAIKVVPPTMTKDAAALARFQREVVAAAKLHHTNIVTAYDAGQANGVHFLVMELVDGQDLSALVKKNGPFPVAKAVNYILQAAKGLEFAHGEGIIHRDIKPANLLLDKKGTVKILDMGLARIESQGAAQTELTGTGTIMGTVDFMAPEQGMSTKHADARADIYSLGCSLYYLLEGKALYGGDTVAAKLIAHHNNPIPDLRAECPAVSEQLEAVFKKMVAKRIEDRYQTMADVIADLERLGSNSSTISDPFGATTTLSGGALSSLQNINVSMDTAKTSATKQVVAVKPSGGKQPPWKNVKVLIGAGAVGLAILLGVILIVRDKDGKEVARIDATDGTKVTLPAGGSVQVEQNAATQPAAHVATSQSKPVDLLKLIDLKRDVISGDWKMENGALVTPESIDNRHASVRVIQVPMTPVGNYQLTMIAQQEPQQIGPIRLGILVSGSQTAVAIHSGNEKVGAGIGLELVDGRNALDKGNPTAKRNLPAMFSDGQPHEVVVTVLGSTVRIDFDGKFMWEYLGGNVLSSHDYGLTPSQLASDKLYVGSVVTYRISKLEYLPLGEVKSATPPTAIPTIPAPLGPTPPLAKAPFDAAQAKAHQAAWAKHLGIEVEMPNSVGQKMVLIPPGEFMMGSTDEQVEAALKVADSLKVTTPSKDRIRNAERPQHLVTITKPFLIGATEVTVGEFKKFAAATGYKTEAESKGEKYNYLVPGFSATDDCPAAAITWNDAQAFCAWLSTKEKTTYRLPTEAEREFACRAGTTTQFSFGDSVQLFDTYGWCDQNSGGKFYPVSLKRPNPFGLFDMHGNLAEWCSDFYDEAWYRSSPQNDPKGPPTGTERVVRGGNWFIFSTNARSSFRFSYKPDKIGTHYGFRIIRELSAPPTKASTTPPPPLLQTFHARSRLPAVDEGSAGDARSRAN